MDRRRLLAVRIAFVGFVAMLIATSSAAAATPVDTLATQYQMIWGVGALALGAIAVFGNGIGQKNRTYLLVGAIGMGAMFVIAASVPGPGGGIGGQEPPANVEWYVQIATTYDTDVDVTAEVLDSNGFTACDGGTPDLNGAIATLATNGIIDQSAGTLALQSDQDDDVSRTTVAFHEIDCPLIAWDIALQGTIDANGDGTDDSITHKARLVSIGPPSFNDGNQTTQPTLFYDSDMGWECAFLTEGNIWVSAFGGNSMQLPYPPTTGGGWVAIGSHTGAGAAVDQGSFACVFDTTNGAPTGYTVPPSAGNIEWSATLQIGSETNFRTLVINWVLFTRA